MELLSLNGWIDQEDYGPQNDVRNFDFKIHNAHLFIPKQNFKLQKIVGFVDFTYLTKPNNKFKILCSIPDGGSLSLALIGKSETKPCSNSDT